MSVEAGIACVATVARNSVSTIVPVTRWCAVIRKAYREQSSSQDKISVSEPGRLSGRVSRKWVKSDCQHWLGIEASKRM